MDASATSKMTRRPQTWWRWSRRRGSSGCIAAGRRRQCQPSTTATPGPGCSGIRRGPPNRGLAPGNANRSRKNIGTGRRSRATTGWSNACGDRLTAWTTCLPETSCYRFNDITVQYQRPESTLSPVLLGESGPDPSAIRADRPSSCHRRNRLAVRRLILFVFSCPVRPSAPEPRALAVARRPAIRCRRRKTFRLQRRGSGGK